MIKQIVVHPKGATHVQVLNNITYWLKQVNGLWEFFAPINECWLVDDGLNDGSAFGMHLVNPIR